MQAIYLLQWQLISSVQGQISFTLSFRVSDYSKFVLISTGSTILNKQRTHMTIWTEAYIHSLVTDSGALRDGQKLAAPSKWTAIGQHDTAAWGLVQGSGKDPYKVCVALAGGATKCNCPSRKFPCKHAVGLMLLLTQSAVPKQEPAPDWVTSWIEGRQRRQEAVPPREKTPDAAAQAKRETARASKVMGGIEELRRFLEDIARQGLEDPRIRTYEFWDRIAGRMVDAQMPPIANRLRLLGGKPFQKRSDWASQLATEIGDLYALTEAYIRLDSLPEGLRFDVRTALGFALKQDEVLAEQPSMPDYWQVMGQITASVERVLERRTWLYGATSNRFALLLDFAHSSRPFSTTYPVGYAFQADLVYYPSAYPQRALVKHSEASFHHNAQLAGFAVSRVEDILHTFATALALNPFLERIPSGLVQAYPTRSELADTSGKSLPNRDAPNAQYLQAVTGGDWLPVFGEWDGDSFLMTTLVTTEGWLPAKSG